MSEKIEPVAWRWAMPDLAGRKWDFAEVKQLGGNAEPLYSQAAIEALQAERDEARGYAGLGCDANDGGAHTIIAQGKYKFCGNCGETVSNPSLVERARKAEAELSTLREKVDQRLNQLLKYLEGDKIRMPHVRPAVNQALKDILTNTDSEVK